jgi:hypothetical protein
MQDDRIKIELPLHLQALTSNCMIIDMKSRIFGAICKEIAFDALQHFRFS